MTGDELRRWRLGAGLTQAEAGRVVGYCARKYRDFESGRREVPKKVAAAIAAFDDRQDVLSLAPVVWPIDLDAMASTCDEALVANLAGTLEVSEQAPSEVTGPAPAPVDARRCPCGAKLTDLTQPGRPMSVRELREWARTLPAGIDPVVAAIMGVPVRAWRFFLLFASPGAEVPERLADRIRALTAPAGPYRGRDLEEWRKRHGWTYEDAGAALGASAAKLEEAARFPGRGLPEDLAADLARWEVG